MRVTGASIIFTGITLAIGVVTWVFSPLQFQADIGIMLTFMFFVNMLGAIILLPALAAWFVRPKSDRRIASKEGAGPLSTHAHQPCAEVRHPFAQEMGVGDAAD